MKICQNLVPKTATIRNGYYEIYAQTVQVEYLRLHMEKYFGPKGFVWEDNDWMMKLSPTYHQNKYSTGKKCASASISRAG
jgi:hypothetical protein